MLKFQHIEPGKMIRAYDFQPHEDRAECFVEGKVIRHDKNREGAYMLVIHCTIDVFGGERLPVEKYSRAGEEVFVPMEISASSEYDNRVTIIG